MGFGSGFEASGSQLSWQGTKATFDRQSGPSQPTLGALRGGVFQTFFFKAGDVSYATIQIPEDYALNTDIWVHLHWTHNGTAISGNLVVTFSVMYAQEDGLGAFGAEISPVLTMATPNIATVPRYGHQTPEFQLSAAAPTATQINTALLAPGGLLLLGVTATTIPTITGGTPNNPAFLNVGLHYRSQGMGTFNRH